MAGNWLTPVCPRDYPTPERRPVPDTPTPPLESMAGETAAEMAA